MAFQPTLLSICLKCGARCCKYGSPMVLPKERKKIIKFCGKDYFKKEKNYYVIPKDPCPYLKNNRCSIEKVKPLDCRTYPVGFFKQKGKFKIGISQTCPAKFIISKKYISEAKNLLRNWSEEQKEAFHNVSEKCGFNIKEQNESFGMSVSLDLYGCDHKIISSKEKLAEFSNKLCKLIEVRKFGEPILEKFGRLPHVVGYSLVQLIESSAITGHFSEMLDSVYIDVFSCKIFDAKKVVDFSRDFFKAEKVIAKAIERK